jgi:hypothetical protein
MQCIGRFLLRGARQSEVPLIVVVSLQGFGREGR